MAALAAYLLIGAPRQAVSVRVGGHLALPAPPCRDESQNWVHMGDAGPPDVPLEAPS